MVTLHLILHELLERENVSVYRVAKEFAKHGYTEENLYAIAKGRSRVSMESLEALLTALEAILKRDVGLMEIIRQDYGG